MTRLRLAANGKFVLWVSCCLLFSLYGCHSARPSITFTTIPVESLGGANTRGFIAGRAYGGKPGDHVIIFAHANRWWVQPNVRAQFTPIAPDGTWSSQIHLGNEYAVALIRGPFEANESNVSLPVITGHVIAVAKVPGTPTLVQQADHSPRVLRFSGYDWQSTYHVSDYTGINHYYLPQNTEVDSSGAMHLRIRRLADQWTCAEVNLPRTLGYGTYRFTFQNPAQIDPAAEFAFYTFTPDKQAANHREMEVHLSRWGKPDTNNAEYVIEPYYIPANVHGFELGAGRSTTTLRWSPGQAVYNTDQVGSGKGREITRWTFSAGVPASKDERVHFSLCPFGYPKQPEKSEAEIVVNSFEFLP